ncbi:hypothetical protein BMF94_4964 [Rhodotorula taiwanensis]|uniref:Fe2OG dioxygenase domain-containing protein n=1 Tax=Rhodotorula taiwanensis TaxID=741276 RepID=A0A2S5B5E1_9BASI|nr:hypothetical protein BMF94_4964 [Rhodotorula taiwanensis]
MGKTKTAAQPSSSLSATAAPIAWPALARANHALTLVAPGIAVIDDFFPKPTRKTWLSFLTASTSPIKLNPPTAPKRGEAERTNERMSLHEPALAGRLWNDTGLREACASLEGRNGRRAVGLNPNMRLYRYPAGSFFGPHYDDDNIVDGLGMTEWTLLIYLTGREDGVVGGETAFYPTPSRKGNGPAIVPELRAGRALLHRHGQHCALHEGRLVEKGEKWVLRSDVVFA